MRSRIVTAINCPPTWRRPVREAAGYTNDMASKRSAKSRQQTRRLSGRCSERRADFCAPQRPLHLHFFLQLFPHFPSDALQRRLPVLHPPTRQAIERRLGRVRALLDQLDQHPPAIDDYCRHPVAEPLLTTVKNEHGTSIPQR